MSPFDVIILNEYVAESAEVTKKMLNKTITNTDSILLNGYFSKTMNTAVSGDDTILASSVKFQFSEASSAIVPNTEIHKIVNNVGAITAPIFVSLLPKLLDYRSGPI